MMSTGKIRIHRIIPLFLICLFLTGCGNLQEIWESQEVQELQEKSPALVEAGIFETDHLTVENNGQWVEGGEDVTFVLEAEENYSIASVSFQGDYSVWQEGQRILLTLHEVRYPTQVHLALTNDYYEITYEPNGGNGEAVTMRYDKKPHLRPNTEQGTSLFERPGYTLACWNTRQDGTGEDIGLGSRVTVSEESLILYAKWEKWTPVSAFSYEVGEEAVAITSYAGEAGMVVVPEQIEGKPVKVLASGSFVNCAAETILLPRTLERVEAGAFQNCALRSLYLYDNIETISDAALADCGQFTTLHINAAEAPYGCHYRRESCYADKVDLLIANQGKRKLVFYGGCSTWFNLDMQQVENTFGESYFPVNMGLNGTVSSEAQLQIMSRYLEPGDILFHTPELSSSSQLMDQIDMTKDDKLLWSGLEYNYDLVSLLDLQRIGGVLDELQRYLNIKKEETGYQEHYRDSEGRSYMGANGEIPFQRYESTGKLGDEVVLDPSRITGKGMERLEAWYRALKELGVTTYVSYACINLDAVSPEERGNVEAVNQAFRDAVERMDGAVLVSDLFSYLYWNRDFYDSNYHLLTDAVYRNTEKWLKDLTQQMEVDGLWKKS